MGEHYITIPESVYTNCNPNPAILYGLFMSLSQKEGYCFISNDTLAKKFNVSTDTIKRLIKDLKIKGHIKTVGNKPRKIYIIN